MSDQSPLRGDPLWLRLTRLINDEIYRVVEQRLQPFVTGRKLDLSKREGIVGFLPPSRGGSGNNVGLKDHDHSGMASGNAQQLRQVNTHQSADTDSTATSLHHTLGTAATQAAAGNHGHALANLTDVALASPQNAQVLAYDGTAAKWKNVAGGSGHTIQDHTTALTQRGVLNFTGIGVSATDNASTSATDVTVPGVAASAPITVSGGNGVAQTVGISPATSAAAGSMSAADKSALDLQTSRPAARIYNTANQAAASGALTVLSFSASRIDQGGFWNVAQPTFLTVPGGYGGLYLMGYNVTFDAVTGGARRNAALQVNASTIIASSDQAPAPAGGYPQVVTVGIYRLNAGDTIRVYVYQDSGSTINVLAGNDYSPVLWLVRLGG